MTKVMFFDLQTGTYSAHDCIDGMFDMHAMDSLRISEDEEDYQEVKKVLESMNEKEKRDYISSHEYEIIDSPTDEDIKSWENYWNDSWNE